MGSGGFLNGLPPRIAMENRVDKSGFARLKPGAFGGTDKWCKAGLMNGYAKLETVLIVDDDEADIQFTRRVIAAVRPRLNVKGVRSGSEFIRFLQGENEFADRAEYPYPDLVLLDLKMPGMHGFDVLRWLSGHSPHNVICVVVLTASGEVPLAQYAYQLGARSFLTKPLTAGEFENMIARFETGYESRSLCGHPA